MKVYLDTEELFEVDDTMLKILAFSLVNPVAEIKRRLQYIIEHKCEQCYSVMEKEWMDKIRNDPDVTYIPKSKKDFVEMVTSRKDYRTRSEIEKEEMNENPLPS